MVAEELSGWSCVGLTFYESCHSHMREVKKERFHDYVETCVSKK